MQNNGLRQLQTETGTVAKVWLIEIQAAPADADRIIDSVMEVDPLVYGRYQRNAFVSAIGTETYIPQANSTSAVHLNAENKVQTFPSVLITISLAHDQEILGKVLDAIREVHHYEEPLIFITESWASRANYNPRNSNPNRWWNRQNAAEAR